MLKLNKILVPTDFSDGSKDAYKYARALATKFGGKVDLLHVIPMLKYLNESIKKLGLPLDMDKDIYPKILSDAQKRASAELDINIPSEIRGEVFVKIDRKPHEKIVSFAEKRSYEMIVMGARGSHKNSFLKGSTAEKVIRESKVPVLTVNGDLPPGGVNRVLIPTDFSSLSVGALAYAASMANSFGTTITMLHVMELYGSPLENLPKGKGEPGRGDLESLTTKVLDKIKKFLDENNLGDEKWLLSEEDGIYWLKPKDTNDRGIRFNVVILRGISAHYEITEFANTESDIVVMATHGRSGLSHLFLGSTTEKVMMSAEVPVLTIRPEKAKK
ncbi:MAG: universal stress protein [Balneolales bacterium]|nr:universal stress protein [Balneolales bacterium]